MDVPELAARGVHPLARAGDGLGAGVVLAEAPLRDVDLVRAPVGDHAPAVRRHLDPARTAGDLLEVLRVDARLVVGRLLVRGAEPHLVVEVGGHGLDRGGAARLVASAAHLDAHDVADAPVERQLADTVELHHATLPRAHLHHAVLHLGEVGDDAALGDRLGERLLQPDVLALRERGAGDESVPVVGQADLDGVDGRVVDEIMVVRKRLDRGFLLLEKFPVLLLDEVDSVRETL